jgi:DNA-directed RNA polymerase subunit beta
MSQQEIINIFSGNEYITNSLKLEVYNTKNIFDNKEIIETYSFLSKEKNKNSISGSPIDEKFKKSIINSFAIKNEYDAIKNEYDSLLKNKSNSDEAKKTKAKLDKKYEELEEVTSVLISEKAAKDLVNDLKISIKAIEKNISDDKKSVNFCYCDILCQRFMDNRVYDLNNAGRYKINRKLCATERLYQRVLAQDIVLVNGKKLFSTGQLILKEELDIIKSNIESDKLIFPAEEIEIVNTSKFIKKCKKVEKILVYADNELQTDVVPIIGVLPTNTLTTLTLADFISAISYTIGLNYEIGTYDDKEHLGNKRFRLICDQLKSKLFIGMARVEKYIKEKLASLSIGTANDENKAKIEAKTTLRSVVNTKAFQLVVKSFFNTYQLTQFADQQNPLSILSNKRKISLLGDGGVSREDPNLDIRDIHSSYYSRICPTETPEGQNIGLIMSLAAFAKVDDNGFVVAPYKKVVNGVITNEIE